MKKIFTSAVLVLSLVGASAADFYVSPQGSDANVGTTGAPFASVAKARDAVRALQSGGGLPAGGVTVWLRGGSYAQAETLSFDSRDSGAADRPVIFSSVPGEQARLTGARTLDPAWFSPVTSAAEIWGRLDPAARGQLYSVNLRDHGIANFGVLKPRGFVLREPAPLELFVDGVPMTLGRWPNRGVALAKTTGASSATEFSYAGSRPERWAAAGDAWLHGLWAQTWADYHVSIGRIDTAAKKIALATGPAQYGIEANRPYYAYNLLEEIDEPGEYYLDRSSGTLYLWPMRPLAGSTILVSLLETSVVRIEGARHLTLRGVVLEASRGPLLSIIGGDHNRVENSILRNAGQFAAEIGGSNNGLDHCEILDCGEEGVRLTGGDRASLVAGNNYVSNTRIQRTASAAWTYKPGISFEGGCGNIASHNFLGDMPHSGIVFTGNNHLIEANEIARVCQSTSDAGAIYSGHDWGYRGNVIRSNFIHHIATDLEGYGAHGVYLDDCVSGVEVSGNVFYRVSNTAIFCGGGRDILIRNNLVGLSGTAHHNDDRGRYRITNVPGDYWNLRERLGFDGIRYQAPPWSVAYPAGAAIPNSWDEIQNGLWRNPQNCVFSDNAGWSNGTWTSEQNDSRTGVFALYAAFSNNNGGVPAPFDDNASLNRDARPATLNVSHAGFQPIAFAAIGPVAAAQHVSPAPFLSARASGSFTADVSWTIAADATAQPLGFELEQKNDPAGSWQVVGNFNSALNGSLISGLTPASNYTFRLRAFNSVGSTYSNTVEVSTPAVPAGGGGGVRVEAEGPLTIVSDVGTNGAVGISDGTLDSGQSVRLYDAGDAIRFVVPVASPATYRIGLRVRSGGTTGATAFWPAGYRFKLDGVAFTATGDPASISPLDPAYGGCYWGTMLSAPVVLTAGVHVVEVAAATNWAVVDYLQLTPETVGAAPTLSVPSDLTLDATGVTGATATFVVSAQDSSGQSLGVSVNPAAGATFNVGVTTVTASATDGAGRTTAKTFTVTVRPYAPPVVLLPPAPPTGLSATGADGAVRLIWNAAALATAYDIKRATVTGGPYAVVARDVSATTFNDGSVIAGTTYFYVVAAKSAAGLSGNSNSVSATPVSGVAAGWTSADVGAVNFPGRSAGGGGAFTVTGSGADIWDSVVGFHYLHRSVTGDTSIITRVTSLQDTDAWAKAGVMIRESLEPAAAFVGFYLTPGNGAAFQWRPTASASCSGRETAAAAPTWLRLDRVGQSFTAFKSVDGTTWQAFASATVGMGANVYVGLAVTSHNAGALATATFDSLRADSTVVVPPVAVPPTITVPTAITLDATSSAGASATFAVAAHDGFGRALTAISAPASGTIFPVGSWPVVVSATDDAGNTATKSFTVTVRAFVPPVVADTTPPVLTVPAAITLEATGVAGAIVTFATSATDSGGGAVVITVNPVSGSVFALGSTLVTATATDAAGNFASRTFIVNVRDTTPPAITVPVSFTRDAVDGGGTVVTFIATALDAVGGKIVTHSTPVSGATFPVGTTTVSVAAVDGSGNASVASFNVTVMLPLPSVPTGLVAVASSAAVRLTWDATAFATGYDVKRSTVDGGPYVVVAGGLGVTQFDDTGLSNGTPYFYVVASRSGAGASALSMQAGATPRAGADDGWISVDVGAVNIRGQATMDNDAFTVSGSGADVWDSVVGFQYVYRGMNGDGSITARVTGLQGPDSWTKAGVMIRESLEPSAPFVGLYLTPGNGVAFQWRATAGAACASQQIPGSAPAWLRLDRVGDKFTAYSSTDGVNWRSFASATTALGASVHAGLAVTSHNANAMASATFSGVRVEGANLIAVTPPGQIGFTLGVPLRIEPENSHTMMADLGANGSVSISDGTLDSGQSIRLYDAGDAIQVFFPIATHGFYMISARVRAGGTTGAKTFWPAGYSFRLDGRAVALEGDSATLSPLDPAYGGCHWGTMTGDVVILEAGLHTVEIKAAMDWALADYVEVTALTPTLAMLKELFRPLAQISALFPSAG